MEGKEQEFRKFLAQWHENILAPWHGELAQRLSELDHSALYSCIPDCFESFYDVYYELIPALAKTPPTDYEKLSDYFFDIGGLVSKLQHIKSHITDAEKGFDALIKLMEEKAERKKKKEE